MQLEVNEQEKKLIDFIRRLEFGEVTVTVQGSKPVVIKQAIQTIKL